MDITNPDLTKKVLSALNPNEILSEDQFAKKRFMISKMRPYTEDDEDDRIKALERGRDSIDKILEEKGVPVSENSPTPKVQLPKREKQGNATIKNGKPRRRILNMFKGTQKAAPINTRTDIQKEIGVNQKELERFKKGRRTPVKKEKTNIPFSNIFPQKDTQPIQSGKNPLFKGKKKRLPKQNISFDKAFPQKDIPIQSVTNPMIF